MRALDLAGVVFGKLTALELDVERSNGRGLRFWKCRCACGSVMSVVAGNLRSGGTSSCGCQNGTHGDASRSKGERTEYVTWANIRARCTNINNNSYKYYGARGIRVCDRWDQSYENFLADMGRKPSEEYSIDRIDNNGDYEPSNCHWATSSEQAANKRCREDAVYLTLKGVTRPASQYAAMLGIPYTTVYQRKKRGCTDEDCVSTTSLRRQEQVVLI